MAQSLDIKVIQDGSQPAGQVVLRVSGVARAPLDDTFVIRRVGEQSALMETDWPSGLRTPLASKWRQEREELDLVVGPDVVNPILGGTAICVQLPGLGNAEVFLTWPDGLVLAASRNARAGQGRREVSVPVAASDDASRGNDVERRRVEQQRARENAERERLALEERQRQEQQRQAQQAQEQQRKIREEADRQRVEQEQEQEQRAAAENARQEQERKQRADNERQRADEDAERRRVAQRDAEQDTERQRLDVERQRLAAEVARKTQEVGARRKAELEATAAARPPVPPTPPPSSEPAPPSSPRRRRSVVIAVALAGALATGTIWGVSDARQKKATAAAAAESPDPPAALRPCGDPQKDYERALEIFSSSPHEAERLLRCAIQASDERLADKARSNLEDLRRMNKQ